MRRLARYAALVLGLLAVIQAGKMARALHHEVILVYRVPPGPFAVEVRTTSGEFVRRTEFDGDYSEHTLTLPSGSYLVRVEPVGEPARVHNLTIEDDVRLVLNY